MIKDFDSVVVHYDEIGLKGGNRVQFEKRLISNILTKLGDGVGTCKRESGQLTISLYESSDRLRLCEILSKIPGIAYFSPSYRTNVDLPCLEKLALAVLAEEPFETFRIDTRRHDKLWKMKSMEVNARLGSIVLNAYPDKKVKLKNPDLTLKVEINVKNAYLTVKKLPGIGGLPTNPRQKVMALLSGGFDSSVAAFLMMKRGCQVMFIHFQNQNQMTSSVENKIQLLAEQLAKCQVETILTIIPFENIQKEIIKTVRSTQRMLIYRRIMLQMASAMAGRRKARFLVVGDSFSQVASQTYDNLDATYQASPHHVFSPLIGMDKKEIVRIAKSIGTYDISALPYGDCCTFFLPKHPELRGRADDLQKIEASIEELELLCSEAMEQARRFTFD